MSDAKITYDLLKEVREEQKDMREDLSTIKQTLHVNTLSLQEHIAGVNTLKELHRQNAHRIEKLEEEKKIKDVLRKKHIALAGSIAAIVSFIVALVELKRML